MTLEGIDDLNRAILFTLQRDARGTSSGTIADAADISASTVRNEYSGPFERFEIGGAAGDAADGSEIDEPR